MSGVALANAALAASGSGGQQQGIAYSNTGKAGLLCLSEEQWTNLLAMLNNQRNIWVNNATIFC